MNLRLTELEPIAHLPIDHFDGLDKWENLPSDGRCIRDVMTAYGLRRYAAFYLVPSCVRAVVADFGAVGDARNLRPERCRFVLTPLKTSNRNPCRPP